MSAGGEPQVRRWTEQRWLVDNVIRANGIDWDQPRSVYMNAACGFEASADFARNLAKAMGTVVVGRGTVPRLLAPDWYDDGPVDIAGQFDVLGDGSSFRDALLRVPPAELPALLAEELRRLDEDDVYAATARKLLKLQPS